MYVLHVPLTQILHSDFPPPQFSSVSWTTICFFWYWFYLFHNFSPFKNTCCPCWAFPALGGLAACSETAGTVCQRPGFTSGCVPVKHAGHVEAPSVPEKRSQLESANPSRLITCSPWRVDVWLQIRAQLCGCAPRQGTGSTSSAPPCRQLLRQALLPASTAPATFCLCACLLHLHVAQGLQTDFSVRSQAIYENLQSPDMPQWVEMMWCWGALGHYILKTYYLFWESNTHMVKKETQKVQKQMQGKVSLPQTQAPSSLDPLLEATTLSN